MHLLYPLARLGRATVAAETALFVTHSPVCAAVSWCAAEATSIVVDARPFFSSPSQFFLAALFLPWWIDDYWEQFVARCDRRKYQIEVAALLLTTAILQL